MALAHRTGGAAGGNDGGFFQLTHPADEEVRYAVVGGTVSRSQIRGGRTLAREEYTFPATVQVEVQQQDAPTRLVLSVAAEPADALKRSGEHKKLRLGPTSFQVEAVLGRDLRFLRRSDEEEVQR
jgi:hypothetical protein